MTATWNAYPDRLNFETTGEMLRFIEKHPEILVMYKPVEQAEECREAKCA